VKSSTPTFFFYKIKENGIKENTQILHSGVSNLAIWPVLSSAHGYGSFDGPSSSTPGLLAASESGC
jgi:hypothetical protein